MTTVQQPAPPASVTLPLVAALEAAWARIRALHPDVPPVVITLGSGTAGERPGRVTLGHFAAYRWQHLRDGDMAELFVAGEGLALGAREVLGTLLHEAAHGLAHARKIKDTSRQGRYHNTEYKKLAMELGLTVAKRDPIGWSETSLPDSTAAQYAAELDRIAAAITAHRRSEHTARTLAAGPAPGPGGAEDGDQGQAAAGGGRASNNNGTAARCGCGRRVRVARSVLEAGPIICGLCGTEFEPPED